MLAAQVFAPSQIVIYGALAGAASTVAVLSLPWAREHGRFAVVGVTTFGGWLSWNFTLNVTHAKGFNTDAPAIGLSWADAGSGVAAFVVTVVVLGLLHRREAAGRVVAAAAIAGMTAAVVDLFVL